MGHPTTYWRLNYATDAIFDEMLSKSCVISSEKDFVLNLQLGHGILLAHFDEHAGTGIVRAIGIVSGMDRATSLPIVKWKKVKTTLHPSAQGMRFWRQAKPYFAFAREVVKKYRLPDLFAVHFPKHAHEQGKAVPIATGNELPSENGIGGYVYVIKSDHGYKIGKTRRMKDRAQLFSVKLPFQIEVVHYAWFDDYSFAEATLHRMFHAKRLEGEWFDLNHQDLVKIKNFGTVI